MNITSNWTNRVYRYERCLHLALPSGNSATTVFPSTSENSIKIWNLKNKLREARNGVTDVNSCFNSIPELNPTPPQCYESLLLCKPPETPNIICFHLLTSHKCREINLKVFICKGPECVNVLA